MAQNEFLARQFSGDVVQTAINGLQSSFDDASALLEYWRTLDVVTASDLDGALNFLGYLAGYPRPLVSSEFNVDLFTFGEATEFPTVDATIGFGDVGDPLVGGPLGGMPYVMPEAWYREVIALVAIVRYYGLTLHTVDLLCDWAVAPYTMAWIAGGDLEVTFTSDLDPRRLWILLDIFNKFQTSPVVQFVMV